jgi:stearoyl-CoA desaturase (delta-9 desaturase)
MKPADSTALAPPTSIDTDDAPELQGDPLARPPLSARIGSVVVIIVPFVALIAAVIMIWNSPFSWLNLSMFLGGYVLTVLGVTIGFHRLFTHKSFHTNRVVAAILGVLGSMTIEGPILQWVATHRRHHQNTDRPDDPHSPHLHGSSLGEMLRGFVHAHFGWFFSKAPTREVMDRYVPDLQADPVVRTISHLFGFWAILGLLIPALVGFAVTHTWMGALMGLIWGGLLRVFFVHHVTWSVNSVCHIWGQQPFNTRDESRNNAVFGILAMGEGWHNNHHAFPTSARHGLEWWQVDVSYLIIRALALIGLASDIKVPAPDRIAAKRRHGVHGALDAKLTPSLH